MISQLIDKIVALPAACSPDRNGVQAANLLLRHCSSTKAAHLLRILPPETTRPFAEGLDTIVAQGFATLNSLPPLEEWRDVALGLPLRKGGLGFRKLGWVAEAAFVGASVHHIGHRHDGIL